MPRLDPNILESFARRITEAMGASPDVAAQVASSLVRSDLAGHYSHGTHRLPNYDMFVEFDIIDLDAEPVVESNGPIAVSVDGRHQFGQVVGRQALEHGVETADEHGVAVVGIRNGAHLGRMGEWAERAAAEGLIFVSFTNTQGQGALVAPAGSTERKLSTNPTTFGLPTFDALEFPIILDMATSQVAHGKISERHTNDEPIPPGWVVADDGTDLTDAAAFEDGEGALRPVGGEVSGYKGFGLSVITELFAGILGEGNVFGREPEEPWANSAVFFLVDPLQLTTRTEVVEHVASLAAYLKDTELSITQGPAARGDGDELLLPGEAEYNGVQEGRANGLEMEAGTLEKLVDLAEDLDAADAVPPEIR